MKMAARVGVFYRGFSERIIQFGALPSVAVAELLAQRRVFFAASRRSSHVKIECHGELEAGSAVYRGIASEAQMPKMK